MNQGMRQPFHVLPHDRGGMWESNDGKYRSHARELLQELEMLCVEVQNQWPSEAGPAIENPELYPDLWRLCRLRDRTSDSVRIYSAMAIEGFLNFYGVLRLDHLVYDEHFERLGLIPKLRKLLLVCDNLNIPKTDPLCTLANDVAQSRNSLVHPKALEVKTEPSKHIRSGTKVPDAAREAVAAMEEFFQRFASTIPESDCFINRVK
jgi:hypothetical protein